MHIYVHIHIYTYINVCIHTNSLYGQQRRFQSFVSKKGRREQNLTIHSSPTRDKKKEKVLFSQKTSYRWPTDGHRVSNTDGTNSSWVHRSYRQQLRRNDIGYAMIVTSQALLQPQRRGYAEIRRVTRCSGRKLGRTSHGLRKKESAAHSACWDSDQGAKVTLGGNEPKNQMIPFGTNSRLKLRAMMCSSINRWLVSMAVGQSKQLRERSGQVSVHVSVSQFKK